MSPKKVAIGLLLILIICIIIIFSSIFYLIVIKRNDEKNYNIITETVTNNSIENGISTIFIEDISPNENITFSEEFLAANPDIDFNVTGIDWSYEEEDENIVVETKPKEPEKWEDTVTQEDIDKYKFKVIYDNMPEEISEYIKNSFEDFDRSLKEYSYLKGFAAANEARYEDYRTINSGQTIMIYFILNDYYKSEIGVLINLEDFSSNIFNAN